jgi:hypothetical protein
LLWSRFVSLLSIGVKRFIIICLGKFAIA